MNELYSSDFFRPEEVFIGLRCKDCEALLSDYLEGELDLNVSRQLERHLLLCPTCRETLTGINRVRQTLQVLARSGIPASFKLRLTTRLQEELAGRKQGWTRPLALTLALITALAILLWPAPHDELPISWQSGRKDSQTLDWMPVANRPLSNPWRENFPELPPPRPRSHAQVHVVSY